MIGLDLLSPAVVVGIVVIICLVCLEVISLLHDNWKPRDPHHKH